MNRLEYNVIRKSYTLLINLECDLCDDTNITKRTLEIRNLLDTVIDTYEQDREEKEGNN